MRLEAFRREHFIGDTMVLQLPAARIPEDATESFVRWRLSVSRGAGSPSETSIHGSSTSSTRIEIPGRWLSEEIAPRDSLDLPYTPISDFIVTGPPYPTHAGQVVGFRWRLVIVSAP